jgi:hypothetical protein
MFYSRAAIGDQRYNLGYGIASDYDFTCRFLKRNFDALRCPITICVFECGGISTQRRAQGRQEESDIRRALGLCSPLISNFIRARQLATLALKKNLSGALYRLAQS